MCFSPMHSINFGPRSLLLTAPTLLSSGHIQNVSVGVLEVVVCIDVVMFTRHKSHFCIDGPKSSLILSVAVCAFIQDAIM